MRKSMILLLACFGMASEAMAAAPPAIPPVLLGAPTAAQIDQRCNWFVSRSTAMRKALETSKGKAGAATTLAAFDRLYEVIADGTGEAGFWREVATTAAARDAGQKCEVAIASEGNKVSLSRPIYDRLRAIPTPADAATALYLKRQIEAFERAGVGLDAKGRAKVQKVADEASSLSSTFESNIPKGQHTITATPAELEGLPQDFIDAHRPGPDGMVTLRTDNTDYIPVITYARNRDLRQRFQRVYLQRAYPENDAVLRDLINKRDELARLVGRPNYATLTFEDRMLNTPAKVEAVLDEMAAAARPAAERDYAKKLALLQQLQPGATKVELWDNAYLGQLVQKQSYGYDRQEARKYFAYDNVRDGILKLTEDMFGVAIRPWRTTSWDRLVEAYEMYDRGKLIGRFYFDSHPRPGKYEHANAVPLRLGVRGQLPVAALVMNLPSGKGLMEHSDVVTFLHEYGHLLHYIFAGQNQRWAGLSGIATEWDFVEAPSQMLENWVYDYDTLKLFAVDSSGKTIPRELVDQMNRARYFDLGLADMRLIGLSNASLRYYLGPAPADLGAALREYHAKYDLIPFPADTQFQDSYGHLGGYGAAVYTYNWSRVIADDLFTRFEKEGLRNPETAAQYRKLVLAPGGTKPAAKLVADFLGRPVSLDAYSAKMEKDQ